MTKLAAKSASAPRRRVVDPTTGFAVVASSSPIVGAAAVVVVQNRSSYQIPLILMEFRGPSKSSFVNKLSVYLKGGLKFGYRTRTQKP